MTIDYGLHGKVALVTGASGGIGRAAALVFARSGASVLVSDVNEAGGQETVAMIEAAGGKAAFQRCDVSKSDEVKAMVAAAVATFGGLDCAFNNAGLNRLGDDEYDDAIWERNIGINLSGVMRCMREEAEVMLARGGGAIVNTASINGIVGNPGQPAYVAAKHGVVGLTKVVALETATTGITCNAICPGWVLTPLVEKQIGDRALREKITVDQAKAELLSEKQPSHEFATPGQLGALTVFLCSDAAAQITGAALPVDGGWTAQ